MKHWRAKWHKPSILKFGKSSCSAANLGFESFIPYVQMGGVRNELQRHRHMWTFQLFLFKRFDFSNFAEVKSETQRDALCVTASRVSRRGCCLSYSACYFFIQSISAKTYCSHLDTQYVRTQLNKVWDNEVIQWQRNWNSFGGWGTVLNNAEKSVITSSHTAHNTTLLDAMGSMLLETFAKVFLSWGNKYFRIPFAMTST